MYVWNVQNSWNNSGGLEDYLCVICSIVKLKYELMAVEADILDSCLFSWNVGTCIILEKKKGKNVTRELGSASYAKPYCGKLTQF